MESPDTGTVVGRLRVEESSTHLTVKVRRDIDLDRDEYEVEVSDFESARAILLSLGMSEIVTVSKSRRHHAWSSRESVVLDDVDDLGLFMEIEILGDNESMAGMLEQRVRQIQTLLNIELETVDVGYDRLKLSLFSEKADYSDWTTPSPQG